MPAWRHLLLAAPLLTAACGGAPLPEATRAPAAQALPADPTTIEEAEARIRAAASEESDAVVDRCPTACRALGSMERAVSALCRLTGEGDERCRDARRTLFESAARTASCGCPR